MMLSEIRKVHSFMSLLQQLNFDENQVHKIDLILQKRDSQINIYLSMKAIK
jgi:hypothetical protein